MFKIVFALPGGVLQQSTQSWESSQEVNSALEIMQFEPCGDEYFTDGETIAKVSRV